MAQRASTTPPAGVIIRLTGGTGEKALSNGNTWEESVVNPTARVNAKALLALVNTVGKAVAKRTVLPVLSTVLVTIEPRRLRLRATDLEITIEDSIETTSANEVTGALAVNHKWLLGALRQLPATAEVKIELRPGTPATRDEAGVHMAQPATFVLSGDGSTYESAGIEEEEFVPTPEFNVVHALRVPSASFLKALGDVKGCVSTDAARPVLGGISARLDSERVRLELATTDSHVLAVRTIEVDAHPMAPRWENFAVVFPVGVLDFPLDRASHVDIEFHGKPEANIVRFTAGSAVCHSRLIDGKFPNYQHVIPLDPDPSVHVRRDDLAAGVKRVMVAATDTNETVKLAATPGDLTLSAGGSAIDFAGKASHKLRAYLSPGNGDPEYTGELEIITAFNAKNMLRVIAGFEGDALHLSIKDPNTPIVVRSIVGSENLSVVMPVRIK